MCPLTMFHIRNVKRPSRTLLLIFISTNVDHQIRIFKETRMSKYLPNVWRNGYCNDLLYDDVKMPVSSRLKKLCISRFHYTILLRQNVQKKTNVLLDYRVTRNKLKEAESKVRKKSCRHYFTCQ